MTVLGLVLALATVGSGEYQVLDMCDLRQDYAALDGQRVTVSGEVRMGRHIVLVVDPSCSTGVGIGRISAAGEAADALKARLDSVRFVLEGQPWRARATISGVLRYQPNEIWGTVAVDVERVDSFVETTPE